MAVRLLLLLFISPMMFAQEWTTVVVDSAGIRPSIAVDSRGVPHLVYFEYQGGGGLPAHDSTILKYASWQPDTGDFEIEAIFQAAIHPQGELTFDRNDYPHCVFHWHASHGDPVHSSNDGAGWVHDPIPSEGHDGFSVAVSLDHEDRPHVSFVDSANERDPDGPGVEYAYNDGTEWITESIGSSQYMPHFTGTSIALDLNDNPGISYYDSIQNALMFGKKENGIWSIEVVDTNGNPGWYSSLQFDALGNPRIAYLNILSETTGVIRLATADDSAWKFQEIDTLSSMLFHGVGLEHTISLEIGSGDELFMAYSDQEVVKLAIIDESGLSKETIFEYHEGVLGQFTSLGLDAENNPHVSFHVDLGDSAGVCMYASQGIAVMEAPLPPVLLLPANGTTRAPTSLPLIWNPSEGADYYALQLSETDDFAGLITDEDSLLENSLAVSGLSSGVTYYWRASAGNKNGRSQWSEVWSFRTIASLPAQVELVSPQDGVLIDTESVTLLWRQPDPPAEHFWLEYASDPLFSNASIDSAVVDTGATVLELESRRTYWWRVRAQNEAGWGPFSEVWTFSVAITSVSENEPIPTVFMLSQNYPNPFNPTTVIRYSLPKQSHVSLEVFNMLGQRMMVLVQGEQAAGTYEVVVDGRLLATGVYLYSLRAGGFVSTKEFILMK